MRFKKWVTATVATLLLAASVSTAPIASAEETRTIADESIYDVLVDRFFNGLGVNDYEVDAKNPTVFAGGDFSGLIKKKDYIKNMGFTSVSIGSVFTTEKYDGSMVTSYAALEDNFGTEEELVNLIEAYNKSDIKVIVDFPLDNVSSNHEWTQAAETAYFVKSSTDGKVQWDLKNATVQEALTDAVVEFAMKYGVDGVRLTNIAAAEPAFLNSVIAALKATDENMYVISREESAGGFDLNFAASTDEVYRQVFKNVDLDSIAINADIKTTLMGQIPQQISLDRLTTNRFVVDVMEAGGYPPTRAKIAVSGPLLLPGVPVVSYGTEIAMNGLAGEESHQYYNFKTDTELADYIGQLNTLRNSSETLRNGEFKMIENDKGFIVFERKSADETWIIVINNTSETQRVYISTDDVGEGKEIRGMFESEIIRANKDGDYSIILDREMVEVYQVIDERGINTSYVVALALVVVLYTLFMVVIMKRGRVRRAEQDKIRAQRDQENN